MKSSLFTFIYKSKKRAISVVLGVFNVAKIKTRNFL